MAKFLELFLVHPDDVYCGYPNQNTLQAHNLKVVSSNLAPATK